MNQIFYGMFKAQTTESVFSLAQILEQGRPLIDALQSVAVSTRKIRLRDAFLIAVDRLKQGISPTEIFSSRDLSVIPADVRYILSAPISDRQKGNLIRGMINGRTVFALNYMSFFYPFQTFAIGFLTATSTMLFVLPQFREILLGSGIEPPPLLKFLLGFDFNFFSPAIGLFFVGAILLVVVGFLVLRHLFGLRKIGDYVSFLSILQALPPDERVAVLPVLGSRVLLPARYAGIKKLSSSLASGDSVEQACTSAGLPSYISWFVQIGLTGQNSTEMLEHGCNLLRNNWACRSEIILQMLEVTVVITLGGFFGTLNYAVFESMALVLRAGMQ